MKKIFLGFLILVTSSFSWIKTDIIEACVSVKQNYGWSMPVKSTISYWCSFRYSNNLARLQQYSLIFR